MRIFGPCPGRSGHSKHSTVTEMTPNNEYLPPREFARLIGISESTLAKARMRGNGPAFVKIGRSVRYSREAGLAWMAAHTRRSTSEVPVNEKHRRNKQRTVTA